jgi:hypothetical protein
MKAVALTRRQIMAHQGSNSKPKKSKRGLPPAPPIAILLVLRKPKKPF